MSRHMDQPTRRDVIAGAATAAAGLTVVHDQRERKPNVVLILADDLGWMDTDTYGSRFYRTPNITRLARRGMLFRNAYSANPLCSPTRASIMTGQYPARLRFTTPAGHLQEVVLDPKLPDKGPAHHKAVQPPTRTRLPLEYRTLAERLKDAGYATAHFGKWHLGWPPYGPESQGFDVVAPGGSYPGPPSYFSPYKMAGFPDGPKGEHIDDRLADEATRFINANRERPFYLNYWLFSVHAPFQGEPGLIEENRPRVNPRNPQRCPTMAAMVTSMDRAVGKLLDALDRAGVADNTLIIFVSDNGGNMYDRVEGITPTSNHPLRGGKATIYEGGTRVPMIVSWPGKVRPGTRTDALASTIDLYPTILGVLGLDPDTDARLDGLDLNPILQRKANAVRDSLFCLFPHYVPATENLPSVWVRAGDWKLIRFFADGPDQEDRFELYNLRRDIGERRNLADAMPAKVRELDLLIAKHLADTKALVPFANPAYRKPVAGWMGINHATLTERDGMLHVQSSGGDPSLVAEAVPATLGALTFTWRMRSTSSGPAQVFWTTRAFPAFFRDRSAVVEINHDGDWHEYRAELRPDGPITGLRLDPSGGLGEMQLEWMRLSDAQGTVLREWKPGAR